VGGSLPVAQVCDNGAVAYFLEGGKDFLTTFIVRLNVHAVDLWVGAVPNWVHVMIESPAKFAVWVRGLVAFMLLPPAIDGVIPQLQAQGPGFFRDFGGGRGEIHRGFQGHPVQSRAKEVLHALRGPCFGGLQRAPPHKELRQAGENVISEALGWLRGWCHRVRRGCGGRIGILSGIIIRLAGAFVVRTFIHGGRLVMGACWDVEVRVAARPPATASPRGGQDVVRHRGRALGSAIVGAGISLFVPGHPGVAADLAQGGGCGAGAQARRNSLQQAGMRMGAHTGCEENGPVNEQQSHQRVAEDVNRQVWCAKRQSDENCEKLAIQNRAVGTVGVLAIVGGVKHPAAEGPTPF